jgi:hypothetical protein
MPDTTTHAERTEALRSVVDRLVEVWPADSRPDGDIDSDELREAMNAFNREMADGQGGTLARLLAENVAYQLLAYLRVDELTTEMDLSYGFAADSTPYFVAMAMGWVTSAARKNADYVFATSMMSFKSDLMVECMKALLDAGAALRTNQMTVKMEPAVDGAEAATTVSDEAPSLDTGE